MPGTTKSSFITRNPKPNNVFYVWYTELCRRTNSNPCTIMTPRKVRCNTVLDFAADRLKLEDWGPLIGALRYDTSLHVINIRSRMTNYQFLYEVDTEDKARRMRRKYGCLWTDYILNNLVNALSNTIKNTRVLTRLELDGLPMFCQYLEELLEALMINRTVKNISLANCPIQDEGCSLVCSYVQLMPNVQTLNLSRCGLGSASGIPIAKLIKYQQLNRYTTSWHLSLRYVDPEADKMCGIRRITLNDNPKFGDEGLNYILDEFIDDIWIKAVDLQSCGITENMAIKILDILEYNRSLEIIDFRRNNELDPYTLEKIFEILRCRDSYEVGKSQYQWCNTERSTYPPTIPSTSREFMSSVSNKPPLLVSNKTNGIVNQNKVNITKEKRNYSNENFGIMDRKLILLNIKKQQEIERGKELAKFNEEVRKRNQKTVYTKTEVEPSPTFNSVLKTIGKLQLASEKSRKEAPNNTPTNTPTITYIKENGYKYSNGVTKIRNGYKNGYGDHISGSYQYNENKAGSIFEMIVTSKKEEETASDEGPLIDLCHDYENLNNNNKNFKNGDIYPKKHEVSDSLASLVEFMEGL